MAVLQLLIPGSNPPAQQILQCVFVCEWINGQDGLNQQDIFPEIHYYLYIWQAKQVNNTLCGIVDEDVWKSFNYTVSGLGGYLDNFVLEKLPYQYVQLLPNAQFNILSNIITIQVVSKIQLLAHIKNNIFKILINKQQPKSNITFTMVDAEHLKITIVEIKYPAVNSIEFQIKPFLNVTSNKQILFKSKVNISTIKNSFIQQISPYYIKFTDLFLKIYKTSKMIGFSFFFSNFMYVYTLATQYSFLNLPIETKPKRQISYQISSVLIKSQSIFYEFIKSLFPSNDNQQKSPNATNSSLYLKNLTDLGTSLNITIKPQSFYLYRSHFINKQYLSDNRVNIIISALLIGKVIICIIFLAFRLKKAQQLNKIKLWLGKMLFISLVFESCALFISAYMDFLCTAGIESNNKIFLIVQSCILSAVLVMWGIFIKIVCNQKQEDNKSNNSDLNQKVKAQVKWETLFTMVQFGLFFLLIIVTLTQNTIVTLTLSSVYLIALFIVYELGCSKFSCVFTIFKLLILILLAVHHACYICLYLCVSRCDIVQIIILATQSALRVFLVIQTLIFTFMYIISNICSRKTENASEKQIDPHRQGQQNNQNKLAYGSDGFQNRDFNLGEIQGTQQNEFEQNWTNRPLSQSPSQCYNQSKYTSKYTERYKSKLRQSRQ